MKKSGKECAWKWMKVEPLRNLSRTTEFSSRRHFTTSNECVCRFWTFVVVLGTVFGQSNIPARKQTVVSFAIAIVFWIAPFFGWFSVLFLFLFFTRKIFPGPNFVHVFFIVGGCGKHTTTSSPTDTTNRTFFNWRVRVWLWVGCNCNIVFVLLLFKLFQTKRKFYKINWILYAF